VSGRKLIVVHPLLKTLYIAIDYDVEETVRVAGFRVE
jgi:hypothetical protein